MRIRILFLALALLIAGPLIARAQIAGPIQYDSLGQPLTPFQPVTYFGWLAPHAALPTDAQCASEINYTPEAPSLLLNASLLLSVPTAGQLTTFHANPNSNAGAVLPIGDYNGLNGANVVNGVYPTLLAAATPPSTDMTVRWAACKWGVDEDTLRAQLWNSSAWVGGAAGGNVAGSAGCNAPGLPVNVIYDTDTRLSNGTHIKNGLGCYTSYGVAQEPVTGYATSWPEMRDSIPFGIDFRAAQIRGCINGDEVPYFQAQAVCTGSGGHGNCNTSTGTDLDNGCVASKAFGTWWDANAIAYYAAISALIASKPWPGGL